LSRFSKGILTAFFRSLSTHQSRRYRLRRLVTVRRYFAGGAGAFSLVGGTIPFNLIYVTIFP
jgi:hypothetical protein